MLSGRFTDASADRKSGGERSWTVIAIIGVGVAIVVPTLIALATGVWSDPPGPQTSGSPSEIVSATPNDRPSVEAAPAQTASQPSADEPRGRVAEPSEPGRLDSAAATRDGSGGSISPQPVMPAPEPRPSAARSEPLPPVAAPPTFAPVAAEEPARLDSASTRGGTDGSIPPPSPAATPAPEPRSSAPAAEPQPAAPLPSAFAPVTAEDTLASAGAVDSLAPAGVPQRRAPSPLPGTVEATPPLDPLSMASGGYFNGQAPVKPQPLTVDKR